MIKQILAIRINKKRFQLFYSPVKEMFFEVISKPNEEIKDSNYSLGDYIDSYKQNTEYPDGIYNFKIVEENRIFKILYDSDKITEEDAIAFAKSLET